MNPCQSLSLSLALVTLVAGGCGYVEPEAVAPVPAPFSVAGEAGVGAVAPARAGSLAGVLRGPAAGLIAENAASVIGGNTAGVIGGNTAGVIGGNTAGVIGGNTGNVIGGNAGNYVLAGVEALSAPVAGVTVALYGATGERLAAGVTTDGEGRFRFEDVTTSERVLFVRGRYEQEGHAVELAATVSAPMAGEALTVEIDPASTLVTKKMGALLGTRLIDQAALDPAELAALADSLEALLDARGVVAAAILTNDDAAATFDALAAHHAGVDLQLRKAIEEAPREPGPSATPRATGRVETVAGTGEPGFEDGPAAQARFAYPHGLALDDAGNLYVADYNNHRIRRLTPAGLVTTIAGDGLPGFEDGPAGHARFRNPRGLAWHAGCLFVVDAGNRAVRRVSQAAGVFSVETVAGGPDVSAAAGFVAPRDLAIDPTSEPSTLYVADTGGLCVRKVALGLPGRPVTTAFELAGGTPGQLQGPFALALDARGALYVADATSDAIRRFQAGGTPGTFAGGGFVGLLDGDSLSARFAYPAGLAFDREGTLFVADQLNHAVRRVAGNGRVTTVAGRGTAGDEDGVGSEAAFFCPSGLVAGADGTLFVADTENHRIRRIRP